MTSPCFGTGRRKRRNAFFPYWWTRSSFKASGRPMIRIASNGHLRIQIPRQMRQAMKRMGNEEEELEGGEEVIIRTASKECVIRDPNVTAMPAQGQKIWTVVREPIVRDRADAKKPEAGQGPAIPEEDVQLVAEKAGVSEAEARKALEECGGEPAEAIIRLMSR